MEDYLVAYIDAKGDANLHNGGYDCYVERDFVEANSEEEAISKIREKVGEKAYRIMECATWENVSWRYKEDFERYRKWKPIWAAQDKLKERPGFEFYTTWRRIKDKMRPYVNDIKYYERELVKWRAKVAKYEKKKQRAEKEYKELTGISIEDFAEEYEALAKSVENNNEDENDIIPDFED